MDANQLLHYLRGFFELVDEPSQVQIKAIRNEVLNAQPVTPQLIPVEAKFSPPTGCGCGGQKPHQ